MPVATSPETIHIDGLEAGQIFSNREWFSPSITDKIASQAVTYLLGKRDDVMADLSEPTALISVENEDPEIEQGRVENLEKRRQLAGEFAANPEETLRRQIGDFATVLLRLNIGSYADKDDDGFAIELDAETKHELIDYYLILIARDEADARLSAEMAAADMSEENRAVIEGYASLTAARIERFRKYVADLERLKTKFK